MASAYDTLSRGSASDVSAIAAFEQPMQLPPPGPGLQHGGVDGDTLDIGVFPVPSSESTTDHQHSLSGNETATNTIDAILGTPSAPGGSPAMLVTPPAHTPTARGPDPLGTDIFGRDVSRDSFVSTAFLVAPPLPPGGVAWYQQGERFLVIECPLGESDPDWPRLQANLGSSLRFLGAEPSLTPELLPAIIPGMTAANMQVWMMDENRRSSLRAYWDQEDRRVAARDVHLASLRRRYASPPPPQTPQQSSTMPPAPPLQQLRLPTQQQPPPPPPPPRSSRTTRRPRSGTPRRPVHSPA
mmetsp:Transcript_14646/g.33043  ORF Transcript_14646/g.33043 Transcript_14646/m.33043 type:complete len:298 (-) Transcript_14646:702-1595(-)